MKRKLAPSTLQASLHHFSLLKRSIAFALVVSVATFACSSANAATNTWAGAPGGASTTFDWAVGTNWSGGAAPVTGAALVFTSANASSTGTLTNSLTTPGFNIAGITFNAGAQAYTMTGNTFNLTAGISNNSSNLQTFANTDITDSGSSLTFNVNSGGGNILITNGLTYSGTASQGIVVNGAGGTLTLGTLALNSNLTGTVGLSETFSGTGNVSITGAVVNGNGNSNNLNYTGTGSLSLAGANTYTGTTTLNSGNGTAVAYGNAPNGSLLLKSTGALGGGGSLVLTYGTFDNASGSALTLAGTNTVVFGTSFVTFGGSNNLSFNNNNVSFGGTTIINLGGTNTTLTMGNAFNATGGGINETVNGAGNTYVLNTFAQTSTGTLAANLTLGGNGNITINNGIQSGVTAGGSTTYNGLGTLTLAGTSTYTGGTTVSRGTLLLTGTIVGGVTVSGGNFIEASTASLTGNVVLSGGTVSTPGGAANFSGINTFTSVTLGLNSNLGVDFSNAGGATSNILNSTVLVTSAGGTVTLKGGAGQNDSQIFKLTSGAQSSTAVVFNQNGATSLSGSISTLTRGANSVLDIKLPTSGLVTTPTGTATNGVYTTAAGGVAYVTANGGATWASAVTASGTNTIGALSTYATGTLNYLAANNVDVKSDTLTGSFTVNTLRFNGSGNSLTTATGTNVVTTGGILVTPGSTGNTISGAGTLTAGTTGRELVFIDNGALNVGTVIANNGASVVSVTAAGSGVTTFSGANTYTGGTGIVSGATLVISNTGSTTSGATNNALGTGTVTIGVGGTLALRNDGAGGTGAGAVNYGNALLVNGPSTIDVNNITGGVTNKTLALGNLVYSTQNQLNVTGGNGYTLAIGNLSTAGGTSGSAVFNPTTANLSIGNIVGSTSAGNIFTFKFDGTSLGNTVTGTISNGIGGGTVAVTKSNSSTWTFSGANTWTGATAVGGGSLIVTGSLGLTALTMNGTSLVNFNEAAGSTQAMGALSFTGGDGTVQSTYAGTGSGTVTFASLAARSAGATENFVISGGTNGSTNSILLTGAAANFINQGAFYNGSNYAWMNSTGGYVRGINYGVDTGSLTTAGTTTLASTNYVQTTGAVAAQASGTFVTLNLAGTGSGTSNDLTLTGTSSLTLVGILRSGNTSSTSATISGGNGLIITSGDLVVRTDGANDALTINTVITGANSTNLVKSGAGTLTLGASSVNAFNGNVYINQGILNISQESNLGGYTGANPTLFLNGGTLQAGANNIVLGANRSVTLSAASGVQTIDTQSNTMTINGVISGGIIAANNSISTSTFAKTGSGTLVLNGTDNYISQTLISAGTLQLGNGGTSGAISATGAIINNGTLAFNRSNTVTQGYDFLPAITGSGAVTQIGSGTVIFNANNTYTGTTNVNSGTLLVNGNLSGGGTVTVASGANLGGNGTIAGAVATSASSHVAPGATAGAVGTLTIGSLGFTVGNGTAFDFDLNTAVTAGGTTNDLIAMTGGTLTFGGTTTFNFNVLSSLSTSGTYTLVTGASSISGFNSANFSATGTGSLTAVFTSTGTAVQVSFTSGVVTPTSAYFNGLGSNLGTAGNFDATVSGTVANLGAPGATTNVFISANRNTATSLVTSAPQTINSLNFGVGSGTNSGITVSGTSALTITGSAVNGNTAGSGITTTGTGSNTISAPLVLGASQTWTVDTGGTLTVSGTVSGSGTALTKSGAGKLVLSGSNTYDGGTTLAAGTLVAANSTTTSAGAIVNGPFGKGTLTLNGGTTLQDNGTAITLANSLSLGGTITLSSTGAGSLTFDGTTLTAPATVTLTSDTTLNVLNTTTIVDNITGNFVLTKIGAGTLNLTGTTTSTAATTVTTGTLSIAKGNSIGSGAISLANATTLQYTGANGTVGQNITVTSGSATINNSGSNVLTLSGTLNKNGTTLNISGGLNVITGQIVGSSANSDVNYINHTTTGLTNTSTYNGPTTISGTSTLLTGVNNALPVTTFTDLTMGASSDVASSVNTLDLLGTSQTVASLTSTGTGTNQIISSNGNASTPTIGAGASTGTGTLTVNVTSGTSTYGGLLGDSNLSRNANNFSLTKSGTGTLALTRSTGNTYTGGTTISAGTLKVSNTSGSATGSGAFNLGSLGIVTGTGTIASSSNTITGNVTPGNGGGDTTSVLTMTATGTTTFTNASLTFNLGTGANLGQSTSLAFGSTASVLFGTSGTSLTLNLASGPIVPDTTQYVLFTSTSSTNPFSDLVTDGNGHILNFGSLIINSSQPNGYYANSYLKLITLGGGAGFNIDVEVVPEPGTWALMLGGLAMLVIFQRARRKNS